MEFQTSPGIGPTELILCCLLGLMILAAIGLVAGFTWWGRLLGVGATVEGRAEQTQRLPAEGLAALDLTNPVGEVEIVAGSVEEIVVRIVKIAYAQTAEEARQRAETLTARVEPVEDRLVLAAPATLAPIGRPGEQVNWQISVPAGFTISLNNSVGAVLLRGLRGRADVHTSTGTIRARDCVFLAPTSLTTSSGEIEWQGALGSREGEYRLTTSVGRAAISLPGDSAFTLDAHASVGRVRCDFPVSGSPASHVVGGSVGGAVNGGGPTLTVRTSTGAVEILASPAGTT